MPLADVLDWDAPDVAVEQKFTRLRASPAYGSAARAFASAMLAQCEADKALDGILKDAGRNIAAKCLAYLHVTGGVTLPRLKALCERIGMTSAGRARALLLYLLYLGYAEPATHQPAHGARLYAPTPQFRQTWRLHMRAMLECAAIVEPEVERIITHLDLPEVYDTFVRNISEAYLEALGLVDDRGPFFRIFMHPYAGTQLVHGLIAQSETFPPLGPLTFSAGLAARRFSVSHNHIKRIMEAARKAALVSFPSEGLVVFEGAGLESVDSIYATQLVIFLSSAARSLRTLPELCSRARAP